MNRDDCDYFYKLVILGDSNVGKSNILLSLVEGLRDDSCRIL